MDLMVNEWQCVPWMRDGEEDTYRQCYTALWDIKLWFDTHMASCDWLTKLWFDTHGLLWLNSDLIHMVSYDWVTDLMHMVSCDWLTKFWFDTHGLLWLIQWFRNLATNQRCWDWYSWTFDWANTLVNLIDIGEQNNTVGFVIICIWVDQRVDT